MTKRFLSARETACQLGVTRSQLQNLFPFIPYLFVEKRATRLFPSTYVQAFRAFVHQHELEKATVALASRFWMTAEAKQLTKAAQDRIEMSLRTTDAYTRAGITELLSVGRATITGWVQGGVIKAETTKRTPVRYRGRPPMIAIQVPSDELRRALAWRLPR